MASSDTAMEVDGLEPAPAATTDDTSALLPPLPSPFSSHSPSPPPPPPPPPPAVDLSLLFESQRPLRPLLPPSYSVTIPIRLLNSELTCVVCLGILRQTTAVTFCLHRFCHGCIIKSLRFGKKECPQCRTSCPSHRNLRADPVFDAIIAAIYPDLESAEEAQDRATEAIIDASGAAQFAESALKGARIQAERARERAAQQKRLQEQMRAEAEERRKKAENTAWIRLLPLPPRPSSPSPVSHLLTKPTVKATRTVTVQLLALYIRGKLELRAKEERAARDAGSTPPATPMEVTAGGSAAAGEAAADPAEMDEAAAELKVSLWFRWADMTDVARKVWLHGRPKRQSPPPVPALAPAPASAPAPAPTPAAPAPAPPASTDAATTEPVSDCTTATPTPASPSSAPIPLPDGVIVTVAAAVATPASIAPPTSSAKRLRERSVECRYPVWCSGFVGREEAPDFVELSPDTTARFLYDHHWDERRANSASVAAHTAQAVPGAGPWKKLSLYYRADDVDAEGRPVKRRRVAAEDAERKVGEAVAEVVAEAAVSVAVDTTGAVSPTGSQLQTTWSPSGATSTAESMEALSTFPTLSSAALVQ